MECDLCHRDHDTKRLPFLCAVDARNRIYEGRMKNLQLAIENDSLQRQVDDVLSETAKPNMDTMDSAHGRQRMAEDRTEQIIAAADRLRDEIKAARDEVQARKKALARRRSDLASVSEGLRERRARQQKDVEKATRTVSSRWVECADEGALTRAYLCETAADLYGLKRVRRGASGPDEYHIGGLLIPDLTSLNAQTPELVSTALVHISHIVVLSSYYLSIRLPAEVTLPHRDYPRPTVFNLNSSYNHSDVAFPNTPGATPTSSESRDTDSQHVPRPRPLFIDKPLPQLSKDDPATYNFFLEGVTLLAYNVAWLCNCQGVSFGDGASFEHICNIGRNLYNLLAIEPTRTPSQPTKDAPAEGRGTDDQNDAPNPNIMGRYSHGSAFYYLAGAAGTDLVKSFRIPSPIKLRDRLKKKLLGDAPAADWEVLEDEAWKVEDEPGTVVQVESPQHAAGDPTSPDGKGSPRRGSNGWMRVKNRS